MYRILFLLVLGALKSCDTEVAKSSNEEFVIGVYFGRCTQDCASFLKYQNETLYRDEVKRFSELNGEDIPWTKGDQNIQALKPDMEALFTQIPQSLYEDEKDRYGCPNCGDWGSVYLKVADRVWILDNKNDNNPPEIQVFVESLREVMSKVK